MDDIITDLCNYAMKHGIGFILTRDLKSGTVAAANTESRTVIVNMNYKDKQQIPLQFAHEIGHIINGDHSMRALYFTPSKYGIELNANVTALNLLAPYYLEDKPNEYVDVDSFMEMFAIPEHLRDAAEQVLYSND